MKNSKFFEKLISSKLSGISIVQKILIIFICCVVIPVSLQNSLYMTQTEKNIQEQILDRMNTTLLNKKTKIETSLSDIIKLSIRYNNDIALYQVMDYDFKSDLEYFVTYQEHIQEKIVSDVPLYLQVNNIRLYSDNPTLFNSSLLRNNLNFLIGKDGENSTLIQITPIEDKEQPLEFIINMNYSILNKDYDRKISIIRKLEYYPEFRKYNKLIEFELNSAYYDSLLSDVGLFDNFILVDDKNRILFSGNNFKNSGEFDEFDEGNFDYGITLLKTTIDKFPLTLYGYYDARIISNEFQKNKINMFIISALAIILSGILITIIGQNISKRSKNLVNNANKIAKGNFKDVVFEDNGRDELAQIEKSFNDMRTQLQNYIEKEYKSKLAQSKLERETTQAKLLALQGQVNPHFLFNALESIRLNTLDSPPEETAKMIKNMSKMFRRLVDWEEDIVLLEDDIKFLNEFLSIQKYRFGEEFSYTINIEEKAKKCYLPKLIIQPLVENACVHGVEAISNQKNIEIYISIEEDKLILQTIDNGGGIEPIRLKELQDMLKGENKLKSSVGLYNVYQRLLLNYKGNFEFYIDSEVKKGTACVIKIPAKFEIDEN